MQHTQSEHAMTRDKMAVLMAKLKKGKSFFQKSQISSNQLSRKAIAKDQLLESRTPGRPLTASRGTLLESTHFNEARRVDRRLVFGRDEQSLSGPVLCSSSGKGRVTSCPHRTYDPDDQELPVISRKSCSRVTILVSGADHPSNLVGTIVCYVMCVCVCMSVCVCARRLTGTEAPGHPLSSEWKCPQKLRV